MTTNHETALIGLLIKQPALMDSCQLLFNFANPFSDPKLNKIFGHIQQLCDMSNKIDRRELMKLGGAHGIPADFYGDIAQNAGFEINLGQYVQDVYNGHVKQLLSTMGNKIINCVNDDLNDASEYLRICRETIEGIEKASCVSTGVTIEDAIKEVKEKTEMLAAGDDKHYIKTGILAIDRLIVGLTTKTMSVVGARPSLGKTAQGITFMSNMMSNNVACGFISVEMSEAEILERLVQVRSDVSVYEFNHQEMLPSRKDKFHQHLDSFGGCPLVQVQRTTNRKISNIRSIARNMKNNNPELKVIFVDYLQKVLGSDARQDKRIQIDEVSATLTDMATDMDVHICCMAQLNRQGDEIPTMSHLKDSGQIEQDSHYIFLLHRNLEEQRNATPEELKCLDSQVRVAKNRGGRTGTADVAYNAITTKFYDSYTDYSQNDNGGM
jgi:replicative DNA helicase